MDSDIMRRFPSSALSLFIIVTIPIPFAGVQPWVWPFYGLMMVVAYALGVLIAPSALPRKFHFKTIALSIFFIWALFLCVPLPIPLLSVLSPMRAEIVTKAWELTDQATSHQAISYSSRAAFAWWTFLLSLAFFYVTIRNLCAGRKTFKYIVGAMITVGLAESLYGIIQALVPSMGVLWVDYIREYLGTARGTFINRNNFAGFIEMIWPLALGLTLSLSGRAHSIKMALHSDRLNRQALMALCTTIFLLALILTRSRAGIISGMVGLMVFFAMAKPGVQKLSKRIRITMGAAFILLASYSLVIGIGPVIDRFFSIPNDGGSRIAIWHDSFQILKDHPMGIGLGNYENVFAIYNFSETSGKKVIYTHNDYFQLAIETGWVGLVTLTLAIFSFLTNCVRRMKKLDPRHDPFRFYMAVGAFSGIASIGVHGLFDFNFQIPANCVYLVALMAILNAGTRLRKRKASPVLVKPNPSGNGLVPAGLETPKSPV